MKPLLLDQGLPRSAAQLLRVAGWDAVHVGEVGMAQSEDAEILAVARRQGRSVITLDADFHTLLAISGLASPSVVRIRIEGLKAAALADLIRRVWARAETELEAGAAVTVTETSVRVRLLPIPDR
ncbi:MAG: DUF5615 family PIN-like protein [Betaproteobacteria bacterium]|nr:DUF5615 family PIN-like protein [Betaproteobacteria bacterium]